MRLVRHSRNRDTLGNRVPAELCHRPHAIGARADMPSAFSSRCSLLSDRAKETHEMQRDHGNLLRFFGLARSIAYNRSFEVD